MTGYTEVIVYPRGLKGEEPPTKNRRTNEHNKKRIVSHGDRARKD